MIPATVTSNEDTQVDTTEEEVETTEVDPMLDDTEDDSDTPPMS